MPTFADSVNLFFVSYYFVCLVFYQRSAVDDEANKAYDKRLFRGFPSPFKVVSAFVLRIVGVNLQGMGGAEGKMLRTPPLR